MKSLIAAALLLALVSPAHAAKANPKDFPLVSDWRSMSWVCSRGPLFEDEPGQDMEELHPARTKVCAMADKLEQKLIAKGYCTMGRAGLGRPSKDRKHCYEIDNLPAD